MQNNKKAYFRFYEELNDFLPVEKHKRKFAYFYWGSPSVKDSIEALGIPHTEVDLILVNSVPKDFSYQIQPEDEISVYPVFETLDISAVQTLRHEPLRDIKFMLDAHLGKLARYLRMLGFDSRYDNHSTDQKIIAYAREEKRIILSRDRGLLKNNAVAHGYYLRPQDPREQFKEVVRRFSLAGKIKPFTRCMVCNGRLKKVDKEEIIEELEFRTRKDFDEFYRCTRCHKIYWKGSHYKRMLEMIPGEWL